RRRSGRRGVLRKSERDAERRRAPGVAVRRDLPAVSLDDATAEGQAKSGRLAVRSAQGFDERGGGRAAPTLRRVARDRDFDRVVAAAPRDDADLALFDVAFVDRVCGQK